MATVESERKEGQTNGGEEAESGESHGGLYDQPLVVEGKRKRKSIEQFSVSNQPKRPKTKYSGGSGTNLGDIARVEFFISKHRSEELKALHRLCFDRPGSKLQIKKNLREFSGFSFPKGSQEWSRKQASLEKLTKSGLRVFLAVLDLPRAGGKEEQVERILEFLLSPHDSGKPVPKSKRSRKRSSSGKKATGGKRGRKSKASTTTSEEEEDEEEEVVSEGSTGEDEEEEESEEDEEEDAKPDKGAEEPSPTDEELYETVKELLKDADLSTVTTNTVSQQVMDRYPDIDLSGRRDYIKSCIEKVITSS